MLPQSPDDLAPFQIDARLGFSKWDDGRSGRTENANADRGRDSERRVRCAAAAEGKQTKFELTMPCQGSRKEGGRGGGGDHF